ncbi:outer membrane protein [Allopseudospirillum japonicum]|uniref:Outer membrane protein n=1 Tax=Allopseudospirillum japonicum TaxID=64971 RepID=A0A1H6ST95_9GAMM|nr:TolC family outer membrane protein [Allopseudospirillum japonicum]SEI67987.1 outer membrane protein [Allopseudospirillum japonicum]
MFATPKTPAAALRPLVIALIASLASPSWAQTGQGAPVNSSINRPSAQALVLTPAPTLTQIYREASAYDAEIEVARANQAAEIAERPKARAALLPDVRVNTGYSYEDSDNIYTDPDSGYYDAKMERSSGQIASHYVQVSLTQPLFSMERWQRYQKAEYIASAADYKLALAEQTLALKSAEIWLAALLAQQKVRLMTQKVEALTLQYQQATRAFELGVGDRINKLEAQSRLDLARAEQVQADNDLTLARADLQRLTGREQSLPDLPIPDGSQYPLPQALPDANHWLEQAPHNLNVRLANTYIRAAEREVKVQQSQYWPEVNLRLSWTDRSADDELRERTDAVASVELSLPLYQGGHTQASSQQARHRLTSEQARHRQELNNAEQAIRKHVAGVQGDVKRLHALQQSLRSSQAYLEAAEQGNRLGLRDLVDVLDARARLIDIQIQHVEGLHRYLLNRLQLQAAVGNLQGKDLQLVDLIFAGQTPPAESSRT